MGNASKRIKRIVEQTDTRAGRAFDIAVQVLVLTSVISLSVETLPNLSQSARNWLGILEVALVAAFTTEYLVRLAVADRARSFVFSFYGLVDLAAILPFYLGTGLDLRSVRAFRLLRVFRLLKLARYSEATRRLDQAVRTVREELLVFFMLAMVVLYLAAVGIYYFEHEAQPEQFASIFESLWWAVATLTTVGYGDVYPVTVGGRMFTFLVLIVGLGIVSIPTGILASALTEARRAERQDDGGSEESDAGTS